MTAISHAAPFGQAKVTTNPTTDQLHKDFRKLEEAPSLWSKPFAAVAGLPLTDEPAGTTADGTFKLRSTAGYMASFPTAAAAIDAAKGHSTLQAHEHFPMVAVLDAGDGRYALSQALFKPDAQDSSGADHFGWLTAALYTSEARASQAESGAAAAPAPQFTATDPRVVALVDAFHTADFRAGA
jgi:hypothetical protein